MMEITFVFTALVRILLISNAKSGSFNIFSNSIFYSRISQDSYVNNGNVRVTIINSIILFFTLTVRG